MKNLYFLVLACFISTSIFAQNNVLLNIHHKLGENEFALNMQSTNNISHVFDVVRLEYYMSKISITHDGGTVTPIEDTWVLVNAAETTTIDLGNHNINTVEKIEFFIGVEPAYNHEDLATYPADHPLGPQDPSMHWGWASGYRFVAMEGMGGPGLNQAYGIHGLGDENYFQNRTELTAVAENGVVTIDLDADYNRALEDIEVNGGVISHGFNNEAKQILENFKFHVFSPTYEVASSTKDVREINSFDIFPNPAKNAQVNLLVQAEGNYKYLVVVSNVLGQQIQLLPNVTSNQVEELNLDSGLYFVSLVKDGEVVMTKKLLMR